MNKIHVTAVGALLLLAQQLGCAQEQKFLPPQEAFAPSALRGDANSIALNWRIAEGYYMYRDRLKLHVRAEDRAAVMAMPPAEAKFDPNFGATMQVYHRRMQANLALPEPGAAKSLTLEYQGCAEGGLCYPPQFLRMQAAGSGGPVTLEPVDEPLASEQEVVLAAAAPASSVNDGAPGTAGAPAGPAAPAAAGQQDAFTAILASGNLLRTAAMFWLAGVLLSLTPCVLPMVPILSTLIAGQGASADRWRGFLLALSYVLGMSLVYAALGMAAGLAGQGLAAALQNPWVLSAFALMLATLSLSMFGLYELQMPPVIQQRLIGWSNGIRGGAAIPVFVMGGLSALVVGPCVAAPLAGALMYISQSHNVVVGGVALFALALGMGVPLLLVGASADVLLPRAGAWMETVKHIFGIVLLATSVWIVSPVVPVQVQMLLWSAIALGGAFVLGGVCPREQPAVLRIAGIASAATAAALFVGAASGGTSLTQPLAHLQPARGEAGTAGSTMKTLPVKMVSSSGLDAELTALGQQHRTAMVDFYADWCVACKEFEEFTFSDPGVRRRLERAQVQVLRVDVTANSAADKQLLKRFMLFGPPAIIFSAGSSGSHVLHKVVGFENAQTFHASLDKANIPQ